MMTAMQMLQFGKKKNISYLKQLGPLYTLRYIKFIDICDPVEWNSKSLNNDVTVQLFTGTPAPFKSVDSLQTKQRKIIW